MDQDSCHCVFHTRGHHAGPDPSSHPLLSVSYETPPWSADPAGALAAGLHICPIPGGACAAPPYHAAVPHIQLQLQLHPCTQVSQSQEELIHNQTTAMIYSDFRRWMYHWNVLYILYMWWVTLHNTVIITNCHCWIKQNEHFYSLELNTCLLDMFCVFVSTIWVTYFLCICGAFYFSLYLIEYSRNKKWGEREGKWHASSWTQSRVYFQTCDWSCFISLYF